MNEEKRLIRRWVRIGLICGITADILYGLAIGAPLPTHLSFTLFFFFGPLLCVSAGGTYHFLKQHKNGIALQIGTLFVIIAGALATLMATMQYAVKVFYLANRAGGMDKVSETALGYAWDTGNAIQLGADLTMDIFLFASIILFGIAVFNHPRIGKIMGSFGILIGVLSFAFNLYTFPYPPGEAGLIDMGPFIGLWFLVLAIMVIFSLKWFDKQLGIN